MREQVLKKLPDFLPDSGEWVTKDYHCDLITPMFGGDATSWELNMTAPVRAQSIKGQLRFWWRTMQSESDNAVLLEKENALWGEKSGKDKDGNDRRIQSQIKISVLHTQKKYEGEKALDVIPKYVSFPVELTNSEAQCITSLSFVLRVVCKKNYINSVINTLKLWVLFGGVGARTRRGCGSIYNEELMREFNTHEDIQNFIKKIRSSNSVSLNYCTLFKSILSMSNKCTDSVKSWRDLIQSYNNFRQSRNGSYGRSHWPEPDAIRIILNKHSPLHSPVHADGVWFPRAAFGLPIITKFRTDGNGKGDPDVVELQPNIRTGDRWPSPVIIKVIQINSGCYKIALVLNQAFPGSLKFKNRTDVIPDSAHPNNSKGKTMRTKDPLNGRSIYQALFDALNLKELQ